MRRKILIIGILFVLVFSTSFIINVTADRAIDNGITVIGNPSHMTCGELSYWIGRIQYSKNNNAFFDYLLMRVEQEYGARCMGNEFAGDAESNCPLCAGLK